MISFIHSASPYRDDIKKDKVTHSDDASIHVLEGSNDVVVTDIGYNDTVKCAVLGWHTMEEMVENLKNV